MDYNITIRRMSDYERDVRDDVARVFVDAYYKEMRSLTKEKEVLQKAFQHAFCGDVIYLAEMDNEIVGMLGCSNNKKRAMHLDKKQLRKHLGFMIGSFSYSVMKKEFNTPLSYPDHTGYIECLGTMEKARAKGVATSLMKYVMKVEPYHEFILELIDTNQTAYEIYKRLGFSVVKRKKEKLSKIYGFDERIYMAWSR